MSPPGIVNKVTAKAVYKALWPRNAVGTLKESLQFIVDVDRNVDIKGDAVQQRRLSQTDSNCCTKESSSRLFQRIRDVDERFGEADLH